MARGRNTTVLQTRVPDSLADAAKAYAEKKGITVSEILKELLAKTLRKEESK
jgi:antitoxin component of RelBE/YafQ-DinJ toxin-antitoxin module